MLHTVLSALEELRSPFAFTENDLHRMVEQRLTEAGIPFVHEARIGPGCRIDYLAGGVGIEIKNGRPDAKALARQLMRYAESADIHALVVVSPRRVSTPKTVLGKPVHVMILNQLWGVALP